MIVKFFCSHCGQKVSAEKHLEGKKLNCPACNKIITMPVCTEEDPLAKLVANEKINKLLDNKKEESKPKEKK